MPAAICRQRSTRQSRETPSCSRPARSSPAATSCPRKAARHTSPFARLRPMRRCRRLAAASVRRRRRCSRRFGRPTPVRRCALPPEPAIGACSSSKSIRARRRAAPTWSRSAAVDRARTASHRAHHRHRRCTAATASASGARRARSGDTRCQLVFSDFKGVNRDTQAIAGWNGGPSHRQQLSRGAGEGIMFGGSDQHRT